MRKIQKTRTEVEVKIRIVDLLEILSGLKRLGATSRGRVFERNTLLDTPNSDFRNNGRLIRVRIETPAPAHGLSGGRAKAVLTAKAPLRPKQEPLQGVPFRYKERAERELILGNPKSFQRRLAALGLCPGFRYEKFRTSFGHRGLHLDLDETPVGTFLELEGEPRAIDRVAQALGFASRDYIRVTYWDLYATECRRRGRLPKNMLFRARKFR